MKYFIKLILLSTNSYCSDTESHYMKRHFSSLTWYILLLPAAWITNSVWNVDCRKKKASNWIEWGIVDGKGTLYQSSILPYFLMKIVIQPAAASAKKIPAKMDLHSPVGALISAYVCRKLARYTATCQKSSQSEVIATCILHMWTGDLHCWSKYLVTINVWKLVWKLNLSQKCWQF